MVNAKWFRNGQIVRRCLTCIYYIGSTNIGSTNINYSLGEWSCSQKCFNLERWSLRTELIEFIENEKICEHIENKSW